MRLESTLIVPYLPLCENVNIQVEHGHEILNKNMPFTSGNIKWARMLLERLQIFWSNFTSLHYL